ncbi:hypothetical protein [Bacillus cereus]|uniref:hypothetical protein n=1 Tax=Bacillus cereus TaxID=1396 RepID=UPI001C8CC7F4|nr:hypothetical protein [Bacillus cereus]MBX9158562.1 hypothetical protein [Bacillus cereus]
MNKESVQRCLDKAKEDLDKLRKKKAELEMQERRLESEIREFDLDLQRKTFAGLTRAEYFKDIEGVEFQDGDFRVVIGGLYGNGVYVFGNDGSMELQLNGLFGEQAKNELWVSRANVPGKQDYYKKYQPGEVPKNKKAIYDAMVSVKNKYGKMMENGEIEPK